MNKSYLIELLEKLNARQMKELSEFVQSPFFNKNESVTRLFEYLRNQYPDFKAENIEKELIHRKVFKAAEYNDSFMRMLIFKLTSLAEQYLAYSSFKHEENSEGMHLIRSLLDLNLDNEAQKQINQAEKKLSAAEKHNSEYFLTRYELEKLKAVIYSRTYRPVTVKDKPDEKLLEESNNLTAFFLISVLQRYRYLLNKSFSVNSELNTDFLPYISSYLESEGKRFLDIPAVSLLYKQIQLLNDLSREDLLLELMNKLTSDKTLIDVQDRRDGLTVLANICIEKGYEGKDEYFAYMMRMDKYLVENNLYKRVKGGYFENQVFINMVTIALKMNETEWTKNFIEQYYSKLAPDTRTNTYNYCYAKLYFKERDFKKALESIAKVAYSDLHMKINVRITSVTIQYELGNIEEALTQLENFKKYVQNDKLLSAGHKRISSNFIKYTSALCKAKYSEKANLAELRKNIEAADQISNRAWLIKKTDELAELRRKIA